MRSTTWTCRLHSWHCSSLAMQVLNSPARLPNYSQVTSDIDKWTKPCVYCSGPFLQCFQINTCAKRLRRVFGRRRIFRRLFVCPSVYTRCYFVAFRASVDGTVMNNVTNITTCHIAKSSWRASASDNLKTLLCISKASLSSRGSLYLT